MNETQSSQGPKQQIVEKLKDSSNILVTVSTSPSVDELSAALGLTILLNKLDKHATAVVSGDIPPAITFLDPEKTFENTVDSLRDFIIALDKEKADHLRYKVDGDVVKIFVTPYRTTITQDDLDFSQGDYNVDLVMALGVKDKSHLDTALMAHGRILHDATVATLNVGENTSDLGSIDWNEPNASGLCEMLVSLSESIKDDAPLLDEQSATALLTGIVAATDRFSNSRTSSKVMTMAAQLMAAGANQQLIASKLEESHAISTNASDENDDGSTDLSEDEPAKLQKSAKAAANGELEIEHDAPVAQADDTEALEVDAEDELAEQLETVVGVGSGAPDLQTDLASASAELDDQPADGFTADENILPPVARPDEELEGAPSIGGVLNATTDQAQKDAVDQTNAAQNHTILTHDQGEYVGDQRPTFQAPFNGIDKQEEPSSVDIFKDEAPSVDLGQSNLPVPGAQAVAPPDLSLPPLPPLAAEPELVASTEADRSQEHDDAQAAVAAALDTAPFDPANNPIQAAGAQSFGEPVHEEVATPPVLSELPPLPPPLPMAPAPAGPAPADFNVLPPPPPPPMPGPLQGALPPEQLGQIFGAAAPSPTPQQVPPTVAPDPNQFQIPGQ
ncbi:hypothetical protein KBD87_02295 [Candidatus Saccharibacteria bacterium]|nr:hypothetical protein [Candidatus Saccharibacteria bacterium]